MKLIVKLSKTAWNNVIIFSVMIIILLINSTNDRLFPDDNNANDKLLLPEHSVILTLTIMPSEDKKIVFERIGRAWQMTSQGVMFAWQQSSGLVQAAEIIIDGIEGVEVKVSLAAIEQEQAFTLYSLTDQLLVYNHQKEIWLALPTAMSHQLIPIS